MQGSCRGACSAIRAASALGVADGGRRELAASVYFIGNSRSQKVRRIVKCRAMNLQVSARSSSTTARRGRC